MFERAPPFLINGILDLKRERTRVRALADAKKRGGGKLAGQIAHINDDKKRELGKLRNKFKTKEIPAPAGGMTKVRHQQVQERDARPFFLRLRMSEYGATAAVWVALKKQRRSWLVTAKLRARERARLWNTVMRRVQCV